MKHTDNQILRYTEKQERMFAELARGFGFDAIQAKVKLEAIRKLTIDERIEAGRESMKTELSKLAPKEKKIYFSILANFPETDHLSIMDKAILEGVKYHFIPT